MADDHNKKGSKMRQANTAFDPVSAALQQLHQAVASEPLPEDFMKILDDIDARIASASDGPQQ